MKPEPTPITAGIDFSASSEAVLRQAAHAAKLSGAPLIAVYVIDPGSLAFRSIGGGKDGDALVRQATAKMEALIARVGAEGVRHEIRTGKPADEIGAAMRAHGSKLLVIAANDSTKKRLGSIASRCVRSAPGDVLVLRDWQEGSFKRIMVCTDFSATSEKAFQRGIFVADVSGAALELAHVMYPPGMDSWGEAMDHKMDATLSYEEECKMRAEQEMAKQVAAHKDRLAAIDFSSTILVSTSSTEALNSHARATGADLVVLGTRGLSRIEGLFIGTNAERLLHDVSVSVLAVRD
jgi:nucleotide-binding universal stress UspA family protein